MSSSSRRVEDLRALLAGRLREIRESSGLSRRNLAAAAGWHTMKVDRIESGGVLPSERDIWTWSTLARAARLAPQLLATRHTLERLLASTGAAGAPASLCGRRTTRHLQVYQARLIPDHLQTEAYARAHLRKLLTWRAELPQLELALATRLALQHAVADSDLSCTFLMEELALYTKVCSTRQMIEQLLRLADMATRPNIDVRVVRSDADLPIWLSENFSLWCGSLVEADTWTGVRRPADALPEVAEYARAYGAVSAEAAADGEALDLISVATEYWELRLADAP